MLKTERDLYRNMKRRKSSAIKRAVKDALKLGITPEEIVALVESIPGIDNPKTPKEQES